MVCSTEAYTFVTFYENQENVTYFTKLHFMKCNCINRDIRSNDINEPACNLFVFNNCRLDAYMVSKRVNVSFNLKMVPMINLR